ncbi:hypothetical protein D1872_292160 [compost metagenome]
MALFCSDRGQRVYLPGGDDSGEGQIEESIRLPGAVPDLLGIVVADHVLRFLYAEQQAVEPYAAYAGGTPRRSTKQTRLI